MQELHLDFETRSEADLKKLGAHAYFEHPSTQILCAAYAFDDEEPDLWFPDDFRIPEAVIEHVKNGGIITAWNAAFERLAWRSVMVRRHGAAPVADKQWRCTMTEALSMNLPGALKDAAPAMGLKIVKDDVGHRLMMKMCKPRAPKKTEDKSKVYWHEDAYDLMRLAKYCQQDVRVEQEIGKRVLRMVPSENRLYLLDMLINDRGVFLDRPLMEAAAVIVEAMEERLDGEMYRYTNGYVESCSSAAKLLKWLHALGIETDAVDREHVEDLLARDLPDDVLKALELRLEGSKTSVAKIVAMLRRQQADLRMRGNLQFYGAGATGRWAARGAQLQNLPRPSIIGSKPFKITPLDEQIESAIECIHQGSSMVIELTYGQPLTLVSDMVRSMICASPGKILRASDFANIEGRGVAWGAGQEDKLEAFRHYDAGTGPDIYLITASGIYNVSIEEALFYRQIGKVAELALGYQGGPKAFAKMAKAYGMRIAQHFEGIWKMAEERFKEEAAKAWEDRGRKTGMSREGYLASEVIKLAWRAKHPKIVQYWRDVEDAAVTAVQHGVTTTAGRVRYKKSGSFLFCMLPSGRCICYPYPRLKTEEDADGRTRTKLVYKSVDQFTKKWDDKTFYGGLGVENITQAIARDIMGEAMIRVEKAGYETILTIHDEILTENPVGFGSLDEFNDLMKTMPAWAEGFPIAVGGWEGQRYRKG